MLYDSIRYESRRSRWWYVVLAWYVPYSFVWYYFERARRRDTEQRRTDAESSDPHAHLRPSEPRVGHDEGDHDIKRITPVDVFTRRIVHSVAFTFAIATAFEFGLRGTAVMVTLLGSVGGVWMFYRCIRYEEQPWPMILLAFAPFAFIWYWGERVKKERRGG